MYESIPFPETVVRNLHDNDGMFNGGETCGVHGDEDLRECTVCGTEFCRRCWPGTNVCPDCAGADPEGDSENAEGDEALDPDLERLLEDPGTAPDEDEPER